MAGQLWWVPPPAGTALHEGMVAPPEDCNIEVIPETEGWKSDRRIVFRVFFVSLVLLIAFIVVLLIWGFWYWGVNGPQIGLSVYIGGAGLFFLYLLISVNRDYHSPSVRSIQSNHAGLNVAVENGETRTYAWGDAKLKFDIQQFSLIQGDGKAAYVTFPGNASGQLSHESAKLLLESAVARGLRFTQKKDWVRNRGAAITYSVTGPQARG